MPGIRSQQYGWIFGWLGGFIWVAILAVVALAQGKRLQAAVGALLVVAAISAVLAFAPWRHPAITFRRLMLPIYLILFLSVWWGVWLLEDPRSLGFNSWWSLFLLGPLLLPLWTVGRRRWQDNDPMG